MLKDSTPPLFRHQKRGFLNTTHAGLKRWALFPRIKLLNRVILAFFILVCFLQIPCLAERHIKIGVSLGLTGRFAVMSDALYKGFKLWEQHVNKAGGILGRPVQVIARDDHSDPDRAKDLYRQFIREDNVDFLFAPYSSLITEAVLPIAEKNDIPILIAGAAADRLWEMGCRNAIGIYTPASKFSVGFLELIVMQGLDGIAIVYAKDPFSIDLAESSRKWAKRFGLKVLLYEGFKKGTKKLDPFALEAKKRNCQVLMVCGHMNEAVDMSFALKRIGWRPEAFYASVGPALQAFCDKCCPDVERVFGTSLWEPRANYPGAQKFERDFTVAFGTAPGYHAGLAYAAGQVLQEAAREAGSMDREKIRSSLHRLDTMTIIGRFGVDSKGKQVRQHTFIIQWQDGKKELVWPKEIQTAEPRF
ncbi:MAG: amino acid ABC transporter substrate-binding protein [Deltaproteobacteria bacterium]|nr:amino acid ABC transporter substrate-binding protein [Deltaproteobacteria bacterium]